MMTRYLQIVARRLSSALYVTADKAQDHFVLLTPYINFDEQLENKPQLERSIKLRGINVDLERIERRWQFFRYLDEQRHTLELTKGEIGKEIADLLKKGDDVEKLKLQAKLVKDDLKMLKNYLYGVEESAALAVLSLPNTLHPNTPEDTERLLFEHLPTPQRSSRGHMEIGGHLIKLINPYLYYLRGDAALFEYLLMGHMSNALTTFTRTSNSDFCRSVIVEGCAADFRDKGVFTLEKCPGDGEFTRTHLVGGASLYSFMAYFTKHIVTEKRLPLRLFTTARTYNPNAVRDEGLFGVTQDTSLEFFSAVKDNEQEMEEEFEKVVSLITAAYKALGYHFRLVYIPAKKLKNHERLRVSIEMFSSFTQTYKEVGHCSIIDSFLSKRLLFTYDNVNMERKFVRIISGTLLKAQPVLACVLENNGQTDNLLTDFLRKYI